MKSDTLLHYNNLFSIRFSVVSSSLLSNKIFFNRPKLFFALHRPRTHLWTNLCFFRSFASSGKKVFRPCCFVAAVVFCTHFSTFCGNFLMGLLLLSMEIELQYSRKRMQINFFFVFLSHRYSSSPKRQKKRAV